MDYDDFRFDQLIRLNVQLTCTPPTAPGYAELLQQVMDLALELYLEYEEESLLEISVYHQ